MTIDTLTNAALIIALVAWLGFRQLSWRPVDVARMWRLPAILAVVGVVVVGNTAKGATLTTLDIAILAIELVVALAIGALTGAIARFRPISDAAAAAYRAKEKNTAADVTLETSTGWWGLGLFVVFIAVRVGIDVWATAAGSSLAASAGVILIMIGANRAARAAVFAGRTARSAVAA